MRASIIFATAILATALTVIIVSLGYPPDARMFPLAVSIPVLILALAIIIKEIMLKNVQDKVKITALEFLVAPAWIAGLMLMIYLLGYLVGTPLFTFLYLKLHNESWALSLGLTAMIAATVYVIFISALKVPLYKGLLFMALN